MIILILHGFEGRAGIHWQQWLHDELAKQGHTVLIPQLPKPKHPDRTQWLNAVLKLTKKLNLQDLIIVGHSLGVVTALDFIEQSSQHIKGLISVGGFGEDLKNNSDLNNYFIKTKKIDFKKVNAQVQHKYVFYGDDDPYVSQEALLGLAKKLQIEPMVMDMGGHLNTESGYDTFPLLLDTINQCI